MRKKFLFTVAFLSLFIGAPVYAQNAQESEVQSDGIIVTFDDSVSDKKVNQIIDQADGDCEDVSVILDGEKAAQVSASDEDAVMDELEQNPYVKNVQPNYVYQVESLTDDPYTDSSVSMYQYYLDQLNIADTWDYLDKNGGEKVKVGIIDSGVDVKHEDLAANLANTDYYMQFVRGSSGKATEDTGSHGTHVAGIIGATANNKLGVSGIASGKNNNYIEMIMAGCSSNGGSLSTYDMGQGIRYLIDQKVQVINMSVGGGGYNYFLNQAIHEAKAAGIIVVAAAGNEYSQSASSPGCFSDVITVNACNSNQETSAYSNYGEFSDITAPGTKVMSTVPFDQYEIKDGTSMACPVATGVVAMMLYVNPDLTFQQVYNIISGTASGNGSFDRDKAFGIVNPLECVTQAYEAKGKSEATTKIISKTDSVTVNMDSLVSLKYSLEPYDSKDTVTYSVGDTDIAKVDEYGMLYGMYPGTTTLTVTAGSITKEITVKVTGSADSALTSLSTKQDDVTIGKGAEVDLAQYINIFPINFEGNINYKSDNEKVAFMESSKIRSIATGSCNVTVTSANGLSATIHVTVKDLVHSVEFSSYKNQMTVGDQASFAAVAKDASGTENVYESGITYTSSNEDIAKIDKDGTVTAVKAGSCYIYAQSVGYCDDDYSTYCRVAKKLTVVNKTDPAAEAVKNFSNYKLKKVTLTATKCKISWNQCSSAVRYIILRKTGSGSYKKIATVGKTGVYLDSSLKAGTVYSYIVRGYAAAGTYSSSNTLKILTPFTGKNYNLKVNGKKLTWTKAPAATKYQIQRKFSGGSFKTIATVKAVSSYTDKTATGTKKYYYRIRGIYSKTYMGWSVIK